MEFKILGLDSNKSGLVVKQPVGRESTAVIGSLESLTDLDYSRDIFNALQKLGIKNVVVDTSTFLDPSRSNILNFFEGSLALGCGFNTAYVGITSDELCHGDLNYKAYIDSKVSNSLDEAVEKFNN